MKLKRKMIMGFLLIGMVSILVACNSMEDNHDESGNTTFEEQEHSLEVDLDDDLTDEEIEERRLEAVAEEEYHMQMENVPVFDLSTDEIQQIIDILEASSFEFRLNQPQAGTASEVTISMDTDNPLTNAKMMDEFEEVTTLVLAVFGIDEYPRETIEGLMKTVLDTDVAIDFITYTDTLGLAFSSRDNESHFSIALH